MSMNMDRLFAKVDWLIVCFALNNVVLIISNPDKSPVAFEVEPLPQPPETEQYNVSAYPFVRKFCVVDISAITAIEKINIKIV